MTAVLNHMFAVVAETSSCKLVISSILKFEEMQLNFVLKNVGLSISLVQSHDPHMCTLNTTSLVSEPYTDERTRFTSLPYSHQQLT